MAPCIIRRCSVYLKDAAEKRRFNAIFFGYFLKNFRNAKLETGRGKYEMFNMR